VRPEAIEVRRRRKLRADFDRNLASLIAKGEVAYFTDANGEQVLYLTEKGRKRAEDAVQQGPGEGGRLRWHS
jgi:hypothetical protein